MPGDSFSTNLWYRLTRLGLAEVVMRLGTHGLLVVLILLFAWGMRALYPENRSAERPALIVLAAPPNALTPTPAQTPTPLPQLPGFVAAYDGEAAGIARQASPHTDLPSRPRESVLQYTVRVGDTLFGIAQQFGLRPETLLWANQPVLGDNPHLLSPGQVLNILPVDGAYYRWSAGDGLNGVARFFGVTPEVIVNFSGNNLEETTVGDWANPNIEPGTWLVIPGGHRAFVNWSMPPGGVPRENPEVARGLGTGVCGQEVEGVVGSGLFIWPADHHYLSGFGWLPETNHPGIDIDGDLGNPIYAADGGVVVFGGWNNWGYGNVVILDHGNGWQTLYAHLDSTLVSCGQSVNQGDVIAAMGSTGNSTGAHLHFELSKQGTRLNPFDYLP